MKKVREEDDEWDRDAATPKQLAFLERLGVSYSEGISLDDASDIITECLAQKDRKRRNTILIVILVFVVALVILLAILILIGMVLIMRNH